MRDFPFQEGKVTKVVLYPLESAAASVLAERRGVSLNVLVSDLIRKEAAIELTQWREPIAEKSPTDGPQPQSSGVKV